MNCSECLELSFATCNYLEFDLGLEGDTAYWIWIEDKFGTIYKQPVLTDVDGNFTLNPNDYPDGLFNEYNKFTLSISSSETVNDNIAFTYGYVEYECVLFSFYKQGETTDGSVPDLASCRNNYTATTDPDNTQDISKNYCVGNEWLNNTLPKTFWKCTKNDLNAAVWQNIPFG